MVSGLFVFRKRNHLSEIGAATLRCYVEPDNIPSRNLQISVDFSEKTFESFNGFINSGEIMYEIDIPNCLTIIPAIATFYPVPEPRQRNPILVGEYRGGASGMTADFIDS